MTPTKLAFVDIETTGCNVTYDRIIEIAIILVENGRIVDTYQTLINPQAYISPLITQITNIAAHDLEDAPLFEGVYADIYEKLDGYTFVAHNVRFDYGFLRQEFMRCESTFSAPLLCTVKLSRKLYPDLRRHNLDTIIEHFNIDCENRHRAYDDAKAMCDFYLYAQKTNETQDFEEAVSHVMKRQTLPTHIGLDVIDELPELPGVYMFYDEGNLPLYIGKSTNIRSRVLSHFSGDAISSKQMNMCQQIKRVEHAVCAGELDALLLESDLIKKMQPIFNRKLRIKYELVVIRKHINEKGYFESKISTVKQIPIEETGSVMAICKSKKQAKELLLTIGKEHGLCAKLLSVEKTKTTCFAYKLHECKGACIGKELSLAYNLRFDEAFYSYKIRSWPFDGPIEIIEKRNGFKNARFIVDKWCLVKENSDDTLDFDHDIYQILSKYILNPKNTKNISIYKSTTNNLETGSFDDKVEMTYTAY